MPLLRLDQNLLRYGTRRAVFFDFAVPIALLKVPKIPPLARVSLLHFPVLIMEFHGNLCRFSVWIKTSCVIVLGVL